MSNTEEASATNRPSETAQRDNADGLLDKFNLSQDAHSSSTLGLLIANSSTKPAKKPGVVYLSSVPKGMDHKSLAKYLGEGIGHVGNISLHEAKGAPKKVIKSKIVIRTYSEGWVEFLDKKDAKKCATIYNGTTLTGKKRAPWRGCIWSMKYLPRFKWQHLKERMEFERATLEQRVREETRLAKREAEYYSRQIDLSRADERRAAKNPGVQDKQRSYRFTQHQTEKQIRKMKRRGERQQAIDRSRKTVLSNLFKPAGET